MKKVFAIFAIAAVLVACNNEADTTDATADSIRQADSLRREDSIRNATPAPVGDSTTVAGDTTKKDTTMVK